MNSTKLIKYNHKLQKQLNDYNRKKYEDLVVNIRARSLFLNEQQVETTLLEILQDLIENQNNNRNFDDVFGKDVKLIADEILKNSAKESKKIVLSDISFYVALFITITFFITLSSSMSINLLEFSVKSLVTLILAIVGIKYFVDNIINMKVYKMFISSSLIVLSCILVPLLKVAKIISFPETYNTNISTLAIIIVFGLFILLSLLTKKYKEIFSYILFTPLTLFFILALLFRSAYSSSIPSELITFCIWLATIVTALVLIKKEKNN